MRFNFKQKTKEPVLYNVKVLCHKGAEDYTLSTFGSKNTIIKFLSGRTEVGEMEVTRHEFGCKSVKSAIGQISSLVEAFKELIEHQAAEVYHERNQA